ncbi:hypothetical protein H072_6071 [Dactylellina haptotyla CBS 200.50]|uniref:CMP/dCMP-type deaminase domain-containing protein n=1 Tax=Dactylellina haptotyla (strain CBS 200.50) TaxID=1284197 RepID=S8BL42_DACHA|nr:hypothetical protein H072_6071 [Dactylellina haptotyla CBS 200.50]
MSTGQDASHKSLSAEPCQKPENSSQITSSNAPTGPPTAPRRQSRGQPRRGGFQGPNSRSNSSGPYNESYRNRSSSGGRGGRGGSRGNWGNGRDYDRRTENRSQSTGSGSPYPRGYSNTGGSRPGSQGPPNGSLNNPPGGQGNRNRSGGSGHSRPRTPSVGRGFPNNASSSPQNPSPRPAWNGQSSSQPNNRSRSCSNQPVTVPISSSDDPPTKMLEQTPSAPSENRPTAVVPTSEEQQPSPSASTQETPIPPISGSSTSPTKDTLPSLDSGTTKTIPITSQEENAAIKKRKKNRSKKKKRENEGEKEPNGEDADNEGTSGSEERSTSPPAAPKFGADLVTATLTTSRATVTIIPKPGLPGGDPTILQKEKRDESKLDDEGNKEAVRPMLEEFRRKDSRFKLLPTRRELTAAVEQMEVYTVVVHSRAANEVVNTIKKATDVLKEGVPDCQHLRRLVKPENLPPSLTGLPESLFIDYSTENQSPSVKINPDGSVEKVSRSRGASRAQRRRRNASYRKGEKPLYVLLCPVVSMTIRELYEVLSAHPLFAGVDLDCEVPFDSQDIPQIIRHTVPQWAPCNMKQSNHWTEKYWPTIYRRTNPYGPHPFLTNKWEDKLHEPHPIDEMDYIDFDGTELTMGEYYMRLARKVAEEGEKKGDGLRIGCVVVELKERDGPVQGKVMAVAHDARIQANNPLAHACYRAISLVGRKRVEVTARHKPKVNAFALNAPNSPMEDDFYGRVPGDPDGYLMNDLVVFMTHEPCVMCSMAMVHSRIGCLVYSEPMISGGLHADLAPAEGHGLPFEGVTDEDVAAYRARHGIPEPDSNQRRDLNDNLPAGGAADQDGEVQIKVKLPKGKGKGKNGAIQTREEFMKETANKLKKDLAPVDPSLKTDEAVIDACRDKAISKKQREKDTSFFKAIRAALLRERDIQEEEAAIQARIAANQEIQRKLNVLDKATQTSKIYDSIKDGEDYLGPSNINLGAPEPKDDQNQKRDGSSNSLTKENLKYFSQTDNVAEGVPLHQDLESSVYDLEDGGKFAQTRSVYAKSAANTGAIAVKMGTKPNENNIGEENPLVKGEKGDSSTARLDSSRDGSPGGFGGLGMIDITGVNEERLHTTGNAAAVENKEEEQGIHLVVDNTSTAEAERGRSRTPAPFKPGTGDFVPVNISYESPPRLSGSPDNDFATSGGEETAGTGCEEDDSDVDVGAAFDIMAVEAPDTAENNGAEPEGEKKKKKKKRSRTKKKKALEDAKADATQAEGFEMVNADEAKDASTKIETIKNSTTHGSSTTDPSDPSRDINGEQNTGTSGANSRPQSPKADATNDKNEDEFPVMGKKDAEEDLEPDELVRPTRPFRLLKDKTNVGFPKYDHGPGDGYGLFWREKLNWKFLCFRYSPPGYEAEWDARLEWEGETNDGLHA